MLLKILKKNVMNIFQYKVIEWQHQKGFYVDLNSWNFTIMCAQNIFNNTRHHFFESAEFIEGFDYECLVWCNICDMVFIAYKHDYTYPKGLLLVT